MSVSFESTSDVRIDLSAGTLRGIEAARDDALARHDRDRPSTPVSDRARQLSDSIVCARMHASDALWSLRGSVRGYASCLAQHAADTGLLFPDPSAYAHDPSPYAGEARAVSRDLRNTVLDAYGELSAEEARDAAYALLPVAAARREHTRYVTRVDPGGHTREMEARELTRWHQDRGTVEIDAVRRAVDRVARAGQTSPLGLAILRNFTDVHSAPGGGWWGDVVERAQGDPGWAWDTLADADAHAVAERWCVRYTEIRRTLLKRTFGAHVHVPGRPDECHNGELCANAPDGGMWDACDECLEETERCEERYQCETCEECVSPECPNCDNADIYHYTCESCDICMGEDGDDDHDYCSHCDQEICKVENTDPADWCDCYRMEDGTNVSAELDIPSKSDIENMRSNSRKWVEHLRTARED